MQAYLRWNWIYASHLSRNWISNNCLCRSQWNMQMSTMYQQNRGVGGATCTNTHTCTRTHTSLYFLYVGMHSPALTPYRSFSQPGLKPKPKSKVNLKTKSQPPNSCLKLWILAYKIKNFKQNDQQKQLIFRTIEWLNCKQ